MKNITLSLLLAATIATPAYAWRDEYFAKLDTDANGQLSYSELVSNGCRTKLKMFNYADADRNKGLDKGEYFTNRDLLGRCN